MSQSQNIQLSPWSTMPFQYSFAHQKEVNWPENPEKPHIHDCYEVYVNVSGNVAFLVNNALYPVRQGDIIVSRPGELHLCVYRGPELHERFCFWIHCPQDSALLAFTRREDFANYLHFSREVRQELLQLLYDLKDADARNREPARTAGIFRFLALLSESKLSTPADPVLPQAMQQVLDYIRTNFTQLHSAADIAEGCHISTSTLNRWFRTYLQLSPHKYVEALKLSLAQKMLVEGCSVTDACNGAGFSDCSRFIAIFKAKFGKTPLQYQKQRDT